MKICWSNLENSRLTKSGNFYISGKIFYYIENCVICEEDFLALNKHTKCCCRPCIKVMYSGNRNQFFGKQHSKSTKDKMSEIASKRISTKNSNYKGGYWGKNTPMYNTYFSKLVGIEVCRRNPKDYNILQVKCSYCGIWFTPKRTDVGERLKVIKGKMRGEAKFYCSQGCKDACPIFNKRKYPEGFKVDSSREVQPELRQMVLKRDNWECVKCNRLINDMELHCHHITGVVQNPIESADIDNCITLCKDCHSFMHQLPGCNTHELKCNGGI